MTPLTLHHLSGSLVNVARNVWRITVPAQKATAATKLAAVNKTGGNMISDCLSQGAQGVSIPTPRVKMPAPAVANIPIKSNVLTDAFIAVI